MSNRRFRTPVISWSIPLILSGLCGLTGCLGVEGSDQNSELFSTKFGGIDGISVNSPTSVTVTWTPQSGYNNYNVYASYQDAPLGSSLFGTYTVKGLSPGSAYAFSVGGLKAGGGEDGISKQLGASTWAQFSGPTAATAIDHANVNVAWSYYPGPTYQIWYKAGAAPTAADLQGPPQMTSASANGTAVSGLQSNTTYYFAVTAKYSDGTLSLDPAALAAATIAAQYSSTNGLTTVPTIKTASSYLATTFPQFTVTGALSTYTTTIYHGATLVATISGNGTVNSSSLFPAGTQNFSIQVTDGHLTAYGALDGVVSTNTPNPTVLSVHATTPSGLSPLPHIDYPKYMLGSFPSFTVSGSSPGFETDFYATINGVSTVIASITGNGTVTTMGSTPLPRGQVTINPIVTYGGETAALDPLIIKVKNYDSSPLTPPGGANGGAPAALGSSVAVGDFNCDGYPDLAMGGPLSTFANVSTSRGVYYNSGANQGGVVVYYGDATGLVLGTPSTNPTGKNPLLITTANAVQPNATGLLFGSALAAGNFNNVSANGHACSDLAVGSPGYGTSDWGYTQVFYGSPTGLQVTTYSVNAITCLSPGMPNCGSQWLQTLPTDGQLSWATNVGSMGAALATGDFDGDGYDDLAVGVPYFMASAAAAPKQQEGAVYLYRGSQNGLLPTAQKILLPANAGNNGGTLMGTSVAMGYISDPSGCGPNPNPTPCRENTSFRKKDLVIGVPGYNNASDWTGGGALVVRGTPSLASMVDANSRLAAGYYQWIRPAQCKVGDPNYSASSTCAVRVATADVNRDGYDDVILSNPMSNRGSASNAGMFFVYYGYNSGVAAGPYIYNAATLPVIDQLSTCLLGVYAGVPPQPAANPCNPQAFDRIADTFNYFYLGNSLANLGDTNGDGYPEVGVGEPGADPLRAGKRNGMAYIYYGSGGGLQPAGAALINLTSARNSLFGTAMAGANFRSRAWTVNDVVVAAPGESSSASYSGHGIAHVFNNGGTGFGTSLTAHSYATPVVPAKWAYMRFEQGRIVGDINKDGYADFVAPVQMRDTVAPNVGIGTVSTTTDQMAAIVLYGSPNGLITTPTPVYVPLNPTDPLFISYYGYNNNLFAESKLAYTPIPAGDMNGDGYMDIAFANASNVFLYYGFANGLVTGFSSGTIPVVAPASALDPKIISTGTQVQNLWAVNDTPPAPALTTHGDFNGDGYSDLVVARSNGGYAGSPPLFVIYGSASGAATGGTIRDFTAGAAYTSEPNPLNKAVLLPTPVSGTWPNAILQPLEICLGITNGGTPGGLGCLNATTTVPLTNNTTLINNFTYFAVPGDMDGDGTDDLVALDPSSTPFNPARADGSIYIFYGNKNEGLSPLRYARLNIAPNTTTTQGRYGHTLPFNSTYGEIAPAGDVNGDGLADLAIGGAGETVTGSGAGMAYIVYGINGGYAGANLCDAPATTLPCTVTITDAPGNTPNYNPKNIVTNSNSSCNPTTGHCNVLRFYNPAVNNQNFGGGIIGLGDITGDDFGDVVVSSTLQNYVYSGSNTGLQVSPAPVKTPACNNGVCAPFWLTAPANPTGNTPWIMVAGWRGVGDIDGDGKKDVLMGTTFMHGTDGNSYWSGGFYLFH